MQRTPPVQEILELARHLSPLDKLKLIERLAPDLEAALAPHAPLEISAQVCLIYRSNWSTRKRT